MKSFIAAIQFLTICPFVSNFKCEERNLSQSVFFFPLIGLLIGLLAALMDYGISFLLPPLPASVITIALLIGISGGFHMDGLADTADGFLSSRPKERILEIMRDSRIGPMGVIVVVVVILLKITALASISGSLRWITIMMMPVAGRCALVLQMNILPYARSDGLATVFTRQKSPFQPLSAFILFAAISGWLLGLTGLGSVILTSVSVVLFSWYCRNKIGGFTGDTLGASCELAEIVPLLVTASLLHLNA